MDLGFYLSLFLRRLHYFLGFVLAGLAVALFLIFTMKPTYRAGARLLVETSQIPDALALSTVRASAIDLLQIITQRLVTREYLLATAARHNLYPGKPGPDDDVIAEDMAGRLQMVLPGLLDPAPVATITFDAADPRVSATVVNDLVAEILKENTALRTELTGDTLDFFEEEVRRLDGELARQGGEILRFKEKNKTALPDSLEFRRLRQTSQQERLLQLDRELSSLKDRRVRLQEIFARTGQADLLNDTRSDEQRQLEELKGQLASARILYNPDNPILKSLETQVAAMQAAVDAQLQTRDGSSEAVTTFELQLADIDGQIKFTDDQKVQLEADLAALQASIEATPQNAIALGTLERDFDNIQLQYNQAADRLAQASTGDRIESQSRGQRITAIETATVPTVPVSPNQKLLLAMGIGGGLAAGLGLIAALEFLNRTVRRPKELIDKLGMTPFATVPVFRTRRELRQRRNRRLSLVFGLPAALAAILLTVHLAYRPLGELVAALRGGPDPAEGVPAMEPAADLAADPAGEEG